MFATPSILPRLRASGFFSEADLYQARFAAMLVPRKHQSRVAVLTALLSLAVRDGHVCLDLDGQDIRERFAGLCPDEPEPLSAATRLLDTDAVSGPDDIAAPMILSGRRLYFQRFFRDENLLARQILRLVGHPPRPESLPSTHRKSEAADLPDWQEVAIFAALRSRFCVISGGPGTGKTHIVARILRHTAAIHAGERFAIALAAPTGKAAGRMNESLGRAFPGGYPPELTACLTQDAQTVHRLLGWRPGGSFRYGPDNPLPLDMLVVDEVSMLDSGLCLALLRALPLTCRLVFVGDENQLPSVGAGNILGDMLESGSIPAVRLTHIYRQARESMIVLNSHRINQGEFPQGSPHAPPRADFFWVEKEHLGELQSLILRMVCERIPEAYGLDPMTDVQVLTPMRSRAHV